MSKYLMCASSVFALLFTACGPTANGSGGDGGTTSTEDSTASTGGDALGACPGPNCVTDACESGKTYLKGRVVAPNGIDPIPRANVFIPTQVSEIEPGVACELCGASTGGAIVSTVSDIDGTFTLGPIPTEESQLNGFDVELVSQKGRFRKVATVTIETACAENQVLKAATTLPSGNNGQNTIPSMAVVAGEYDAMECVLLNLGLNQNAFDRYSGTLPEFSGGEPSFQKLLNDLELMKSYNIIFINCAANEFESQLQNAKVKTNIEEYVASGGRLYVTDWSYDYIEQVTQFSPFIDFGPGESAAQPEAMNAGAVGPGDITIQAAVNDTDLAEWLRADEKVTGDEIINDNNKVHIEHFLPQWVMQFAAGKNSSVWLSGAAQGAQVSGERPLTTSFDYKECGRVIYSSYHTLGRPDLESLFPIPLPYPEYCSEENLSPQEKVLLYLILHAADCIDSID